MIKLAIFDFDGTLADTMPVIIYATNKSREAVGYPPVEDSFIYEHVNEPTMEFIGNVHFDISDDKKELAKQKFSELYVSENSRLTVPFDGIVDVVKKLRALGMKTAVFSNKADVILKPATAEMFPGLFDYVLGAGIYKSKPDKEGTNVIINALGAEPASTVYIGDSDVDVNTAKNAGTEIVGVAWGYRGHNFLAKICDNVVDTADELYEKIVGMN